MKNITRKDILQIVLFIVSFLIIGVTAHPQRAIALQPPEPFVAIHVSELTEALESMPAVPPTPTGPERTGYQWWYTSWHYFVAYESLEEALRSDGTPFVEVSDADIAAGMLLNPDGSPRYPILISLASEAIADDEIAPLQDYANAGGFVIVGSSAFTRRPDGSYREDFALAAEMGLHMANPVPSSLNGWNWYQNAHFTKSLTNRLVSHIPNGTLTWSMPLTADEIPWGIMPGIPADAPPRLSWTWSVVADGATVIANGDSGPLLAVKSYGQGQFIYDGAMQPILGNGATDPSMYAYYIYRKAIEWAFESSGLPILKLSPWRYPYDAALEIRHDGETYIDQIEGIEASAQFESSLGAKGDYYFCTGALRTYTEPAQESIISSLRNAVTLYGATIGSHNGGLGHPAGVLPTSYYYWHWGPDEALDLTPEGYASGKEYAYASIEGSFQDIEGWLSGVDNGRPGCGASGTCPRTFVAPYFNATREDSKDVLAELGSVTAGEQKVGPFPHWTLSYDVPGKVFPLVSLPASDWFVGTSVPPALEMGHTSESIMAAIDFYYDIGGLLNFYGHQPSDDGSLEQLYVEYSMSKPGIWPTNAVDIYDWWRLRSTVEVIPAISIDGATYTQTASISGATDPDTAVEIVFPQDQGISDMSILLNGTPAGPSDYRTTDHGVKIRVGSSVSDVQVQYTVTSNPLPTTLSLSPATADAGGLDFTLTVYGTGFLNGSVVRWNGSGRTTTYVSSTQLTAAITASDIETVGTASVTVFNPAPGGGTSNAQTFTITAASSYTVTPSAGPNGTISPGTEQIVNPGETISLTVIPNAGYHIASVTGCGGTLNGNTYTATITGNCTVTATFASGTYAVRRMSGAIATDYASLQDAYAAALDGDSILSQEVVPDGSLELNRSNISIRLKGGYDPLFSSQTGYTTLGSLTISDGTVTAGYLVLK